MAAKSSSDEGLKAKQQGWVKATLDFLTAWAEYAGEYHKSGIVWKFKGIAVTEFKAGAKAEKKEGKQTVEERLASIAERLERYAAKLSKGGDDGESAAVAEYKAFYASRVEPFIQATNKFPELKKIAEWTQTAFEQQGRLIAAASKSTKPKDEEVIAFIPGVVQVINDSGNCDNRSPFFNFQKAFNEAVTALSWLTMPGPAGYIHSQADATALYTTKILMAAKNKQGDAQNNDREWAGKLKELLVGLEEYAKENHKMGLTWAAKGKPLKEYK